MQKCTPKSFGRGNIVAKYVGVRLIDAIYKIDNIYEYSLPERLIGKALPGRLAVVPFGGGNISKTAVIISVSDTCSYEKVKPVHDIPDTEFYLKPDLLEICNFLCEMCFCTFGEAVRTVCPSGISVRVKEYYSICDGVSVGDNLYGRLNDVACDIVSFIACNEKVTPAQLAEKFGDGAKSCVASLVKQGYIEKRADSSFHENKKTTKYIRLLLGEDEICALADSGSRLFSAKQKEALRTLYECGGMCSCEELCELSGCGMSVLNELKKKSAAEFVAVKDYRSPIDLSAITPSSDFTLSEEQQKAYDTLCSLYSDKAAKAALLYGVTGSGKTNVILKLIDKVVADGKQVIYLVPEIALTSQNIAIFAGRYGDNIAVLHSALSVGEKQDAWHRINEGTASVVIGTRSAIFAPVRNLGLIVIDEEQESSFKSDMSPKYHARDIARFRCAKTNSLMLLASATPSIESFFKAKEGKYTLVTMKNRYGKARLPDVIIHDMKREPAYMGECGEGLSPSMIGTTLADELEKNLANKEQSILFINRRGYHAFLTCRSCGTALTCPNCSVAMTYHKYKRRGYRIKDGGEMVCHYCGFTRDVPKLCPTCSSEHIAFLGNGTQTLEENLEKDYPYASVLRMDADTTSCKHSHEEILTSFRKGEADILIGTQMVTKGHDFPNVTLAGVVLADTSLYLNDYRANEKTFSLLTQVLGRAGRSEKPGRAVIQTYSPDNTSLLLSARQDYDAFYEDEIKLRRAAIFPPFCDIVTFLFSGENEQAVKNAAEEFGRKLDLYAKSEFSSLHLIVFGPFEATVYKLNGKYRLRYIIKCRYDKNSRRLFKKLFGEFSTADENLTISADVNPSSL